MSDTAPAHHRSIRAILILHVIFALGFSAVGGYAMINARRVTELREVKVKEENRNREQIRAATDIEELRKAALALQDRSTKDRDSMEAVSRRVPSVLLWLVGLPVATAYFAAVSLRSMRKGGRDETR